MQRTARSHKAPFLPALLSLAILNTLKNINKTSSLIIHGVLLELNFRALQMS